MAENQNIKNIPFLVVLPEEQAEQVKDNTKGIKDILGIFSSDDEETIATVNIPVDRLKENMKTVCGGIAQVFKDIREVGGFRLTEISLQVEINAEGGVNFIGTSKIGGKGAITLKFSE